MAIEAKDLAKRVGMDPKRVRRILRAKFPRTIQEFGDRWMISDETAKAVEALVKAKGYKTGFTPATKEVKIPGVEFVQVPPGVEIVAAPQVEEETDTADQNPDQAN